MLKYNSDWRTVAFSTLCMLSYTVQWNMEFTYMYVHILLFIVTSLQAFQQTVIVHNCAHCHPFKSRMINEAFFLMLSVLSSAPVSLYVPGHNLSHHKHLETEKDVMRTSRMKYGSELLNLLLFVPTILVDIQRNDLHYMLLQYRRGNPIFWRFIRESVATHVCIVALLLVDYKRAIFVYVLPTLIGKYMIISLNMLQHYGCDPGSKFNHSRNFTGSVLNYLFFNNGYHTVHHNAPGLHWSKARVRHQEIQSFIRPSLNQESIVGYVLAAHVIHKEPSQKCF